MNWIGLFIAIYGIAGIILPYFNIQLTWLLWTDKWGPQTSLIIKGGMIVVGLIIFVLSRNKEDDQIEVP